MTVELDTLLAGLEDRTSEKFQKKPEVVAKNESFDVSKLPIEKPEWHAIDDLVCVYFDLKASTELAMGRTPASTASIYDAGVGGVTKILREFDSDFVDVQGDGGFGLFWGELRFERAITAAITIRTFSMKFTEQLEKKWKDAPTTGFKVGISSGPIMAKRVGLPRQLEFQEPVWAGNPVNYAAKAAQQASPETMFVTGSVFDKLFQNDFLMFSCDCSEPSFLWNAVELENIPDDERFGMSLTQCWCAIHRQEFCNSVLSGETHREEVTVEAREISNRVREGERASHEAVLSRDKKRAQIMETFSKLRSSS